MKFAKLANWGEWAALRLAALAARLLLRLAEPKERESRRVLAAMIQDLEDARHG